MSHAPAHACRIPKRNARAKIVSFGVDVDRMDPARVRTRARRRRRSQGRRFFSSWLTAGQEVRHAGERARTSLLKRRLMVGFTVKIVGAEAFLGAQPVALTIRTSRWTFDEIAISSRVFVALTIVAS